MMKVAPPVHVDKLIDLFPFVEISHQASELLFMEEVGKYFHGKYFPTQYRSSGAWWHITILKQRCRRAQFLYIPIQNLVNKCHRYSMLMRRIYKQHVPWSVGRHCICLDTWFKKIWLWAYMDRK